MVGVALDVDDVLLRVLAVAARVDDDAAGDGAVGADGAGLGRARDLELLGLGDRGRQVEAEGLRKRPAAETFRKSRRLTATVPTSLDCEY
jgi:hypothetical protein